MVPWLKRDKVWRHNLTVGPLRFHFSSVKMLLSDMWECCIFFSCLYKLYLLSKQVQACDTWANRHYQLFFLSCHLRCIRRVILARPDLRIFFFSVMFFYSLLPFFNMKGRNSLYVHDSQYIVPAAKNISPFSITVFHPMTSCRCSLSLLTYLHLFLHDFCMNILN